MLRRIQRTVLAGYIWALVILLLVGVGSIFMTRRFIRDSQWSEHSQDVIISLDELRASLLDARGFARSHLIAPAPGDRQQFENAASRARSQLGDARHLTVDNPAQLERVNKLSTILDERLEQLSIGLYDWDGNQEGKARDLIAGATGQSTSAEFQRQFDEIVAAEGQLLHDRDLGQSTTANAVMAITVGGAAMALALISVAFWRIRAGLNDRARALDELEKARAEAEAANRFKSDFLANMSHEIRSPVAAIIGYGDILLDPDMNASERLECISTVRRNGMHLLTLINDILDLSKVEAGRLHVELIECNPCLIIGDVASMMRVRAGEKNLTLEIKVDGVIPEKIKSDPMRLRQILINLLSNAVKFTDQGWVRLIVKLMTAPEDPAPRLRFDVVDTGVGMSAEEAAHIFQPFVQGDSSTTRRFGGTGLGLSISKRLAEFLGGTIRVDSAPGRGSTFSLEILTGPLKDVRLLSRCTESTYDTDSGEYRPAETVATGSQGRVLVAEDGQDNRNLIAYVLRRGGYHVEFAENGRMAVQMATDAERLSRPFDAVLMDMQMPEMDGYAATAKLRSLGFARPVIALTANAMKTDRDKCLAAGCTDYLSKPVDRRMLLQCLHRHVPRPAPGAGERQRGVAGGNGAGSQGVGGAEKDGATTAKPSIHDGMAQLRQDFIVNLPTYMSDLARALTAQDAATAQRVLHQLSGIGGVFDFQWITDEATPLDQRLKAGEPVAALAPLIEAFMARVRKVDGYDGAREAQLSQGQ